LIQQKLPGYTKSKAFELIKLVRNDNGGKLVGLKMKKFMRMSKVIASRDVAKNKEIRRVEQLERARLEATCPFCFRMFIEKFSCDRHVKNKHSKHLPKTVRKPAGKAVECLTCKKTFYNKTNLKGMKRIMQKIVQILNVIFVIRSFQERTTYSSTGKESISCST
jgi:hypothetical protein